MLSGLAGGGGAPADRSPVSTAAEADRPPTAPAEEERSHRRAHQPEESEPRLEPASLESRKPRPAHHDPELVDAIEKVLATRRYCRGVSPASATTASSVAVIRDITPSSLMAELELARQTRVTDTLPPVRASAEHRALRPSRSIIDRVFALAGLALIAATAFIAVHERDVIARFLG
jgi:hypothetical protein